MVKASARAAAPDRPRPAIGALLDATADPDGRGLLLRGLEYQPLTLADLDQPLAGPLLHLARLAESVAHALRDHPDLAVRRSAAVLAARAHPVRSALDA